MKWLLNLLWAGLLFALAPVLAWKMLRHGRYRRGWKEKLFGQLPTFEAGVPVVWFHAVSVGEVVQLQKIVSEFRAAAAEPLQILVTTSTDTGFDLATQRFSDCVVSWFPLDFSWSVDRALRRVQPRMVVLVELELWPGFLTACQRNQVATVMVNARLSDRSFRGYSRIRSLLAPLLRSMSLIAAQTSEYAERLVALGADQSRVVVTGSLKFDGVETSRKNTRTQQLRHLFGISDSDLVLIAGSTQPPEEQFCLKAWRQCVAAGEPVRDRRNEYAQDNQCAAKSGSGQGDRCLRLIIVPRHQERFDEVAAFIEGQGCKVHRRSQLSEGDAIDPEAVILLDTIGELSACWGLADIAFVGGSFGSRGGQNMLEPAAYGSAVTFGPATQNFRDIVRRLLASDAAIEVSSVEGICETWQSLVSDDEARRQLGQRARQFVLSQRGALNRTVSLLLNVWQDTDEVPAAKHAA